MGGYTTGCLGFQAMFTRNITVPVHIVVMVTGPLMDKMGQEPVLMLPSVHH